MMEEPQTKVVLWVALIVLGGMAMVAYAMEYGIGISPDSTIYLDAARHLEAGQGLIAQHFDNQGGLQPLTQYPPLLPIVLAALLALHIPVLVGAQVFNILLLAATTSVAGILLYRATSRSHAGTILGTLLIVSSMDVLQSHTMVWSEPLFIFLMVLDFALLDNYRATGRRRMLVAVGVVTALATLTRYVGVVLFVVAGFVILLGGQQKYRRRMVDTVFVTVLGIAPLAGWFLRNLSITGSATQRRMAFHPVQPTEIMSAVRIAAQWLVPPLPTVTGTDLRIAFAGVLVGSLAWIRPWRLQAGEPRDHARNTSSQALGTISGFFIIVYLGFLMVSISFFDANTQIDNRILVPVLVAGIIAGVPYACLVVRPFNRRHKGWLMTVMSAIILLNLGRSAVWVQQVHAVGQGFTAKSWRESATMRALAELPGNRLVWSNIPDAIYTLSGRAAFPLPRRIDPYTLMTNGQFVDELQRMREQVVHDNGIVVYFRQTGGHWQLVTEEELLKAIPLRIYRTTLDGTIYELANGP